MRSRSLTIAVGTERVSARRHANSFVDVFASIDTSSNGSRRRQRNWLRYRQENRQCARGARLVVLPAGDPAIGVALTAAAVPLWMHLSLMEECRGRVERALAAIAAGTGGDARREMRLHAALAQSLMYSRGAVSEIGAVGTKALEIAESLDDVEYQLRSLWGLWSFHISTRPALRRSQPGSTVPCVWRRSGPTRTIA